MSAGFYRVDPSGELLHGGTLTTPTGVYVAKDQAKYTYPIDGAWRYFGSEGEALAFFTASPEPSFVPNSVTPLQARMALLRAGLLDAVEAAVKSAGGEVQIAWEYAVAVDRKSPMVAALATALGLSSELVDDLFREAARL